MRKLFLVSLFFFLSCGGSAAVNIDVQIASNQTENPMLRIAADLKAIPQKSLGIFFKFDALQCNTLNTPDGSAQIVYPKNFQEGNSPTQNSYPIPNSLLNLKKYYQVTMVALDSAKLETHIGVSDCPINLSVASAHKATICFGKNTIGNQPLCPGLTPFNKCPGISQGICPN